MKEWFYRVRIAIGSWIMPPLEARHINIMARKVYTQRDVALLAANFGLIVKGAVGCSFGEVQASLHAVDD